MKELIAQVEPLIPALRRYLRALLRERDVADDLAQDCLERVIERWGQRRRADDTRQWVFAIAHNLAVDWLRQQTRRGLHLAVDDIDEAEMAVPAPQEGHMRHNDLLRVLATLPEEQRSVLLLVTVEDLSYADAAKTLDIPIGTVMSRLARGRERLQRAMDGGDPGAQPRQQPATRPLLRRLK